MVAMDSKLQNAQQLFLEVKKSFEINKSCKIFIFLIFLVAFMIIFCGLVQFNSSHDALKAAVQLIGNCDAMQFIDDFLYKIIHTMTHQKYFFFLLYHF
jgi:hypothetical protein